MGRKVLNFPDQYRGDLFVDEEGNPRLWWIDDSKWAEREYVTTRERPVEDMALLHIWLAARAMKHLDLYRYSLTSIEARVLDLEQICLRYNRHYSAGMRYEWIARKMGQEYSPRQVKLLLDDVTDILRRAEMVQVLDLIEAAEKRKTVYFRDLVKEALREEIAQVKAA